MDKITPFLDSIMLVAGPYLPTIAVAIASYFLLGLFEELINIHGIWKFVAVIIITVLFYNFGDDVAARFTQFMRFLGLQPPQPGMYK